MTTTIFAALLGGGIVLALAAPAHPQALQTHRIPAALALEAVGEAVAACSRQGYSETAVLVDADGVRQAVLRGDGAGAHTLDSANDKAYTAASFKNDTAALVERAKTAPIAPLLAKLPHLLLFGGGVVINIGDEVVGAIGAAGAPGGDLDDHCARAGLDKIKDRLR
ncbi:MAG TPA: heme-binding protein [Stellaceae bacterium]|nr:heme-binding protein [Stellaceae bacterium]